MANKDSLINIVKKVIDPIDDIVIAVSRWVSSVSPKIGSYLYATLGSLVHMWEFYLARKDYKKADDDNKNKNGQRNFRKFVAGVSQIFTIVGIGLGISLFFDTAGIINARGVELYPFLISGLLVGIYGLQWLRKLYSKHEEPRKEGVTQRKINKVELEFKYGSLEVLASTVTLCGIMLGTDRYFSNIRDLATPNITENSSYIIVVGVILGIVVKYKEHKDLERWKASYAEIKDTLLGKETTFEIPKENNQMSLTPIPVSPSTLNTFFQPGGAQSLGQRRDSKSEVNLDKSSQLLLEAISNYLNINGEIPDVPQGSWPKNRQDIPSQANQKFLKIVKENPNILDILSANKRPDEKVFACLKRMGIDIPVLLTDETSPSAQEIDESSQTLETDLP